MNCSEYSCVKKLLLETVAYVFTDILFLDNHILTFLKNGFKLLKDKALQTIPK